MFHSPALRLLILSLAAEAAHGQPTQLSGLIQDSSGGVMAGVSVTLQNQDTGIRRLARTNAEGIYVIPSLQPGPYKITVRKEGFRSLARTGFLLELGQHARVDFALQVGSVDEVITVESSPLWFSGEAGAVGTLVPRAFVDHLPVNGRGLLTLLELSPGLLITPVTGSNDAGQFSVNGLRPNANLITIDGASANFGIQDDGPGSAVGGNLPALSSIGSLHSLVSLAAVEEFRLDAVAGAAEHGRFAGVHLTLATRSGGNVWHGSAQHFFRNEKLDANSWFANLIGQPRAPFRWNQSSGATGGPISPNRTFVYASYEGFRMRQPTDVAIQVPTREERGAATSPLSRKLVALYPEPNYTPIPEVALLLGRTAQPARLDSASLRIDHASGSNWNLFSRFHTAPSSSELGSLRRSLSSGASLLKGTYLPVQWASGLGITLNSGAYFDLRASYSRMSIDQSVSPYRIDLTGLLGESALANRSWSLRAGPGWSSLESIRGIRRAQSQWQVSPALSAVRGSHQWKLGADVRLLRPTLTEPAESVTAFYPAFDSLEGAGFSFSTLTRNAPLRLRFWNASAYFQDSWKIHPAVTVHYGLRWEWNPPPATRDAMPTYGVAGLLDGSGPRLALAGAPAWPRRHRDFAPRVSLAYRGPAGLVLHAGTGLHYSLLAGSVFEAWRSQPSFRASADYTGRSLPALIATPAPELTATPDSSPLLTAYAENVRTPVSLQSNVTLETAAGRAGTVSGGWVNTLGRRLLRTEFSRVDVAAAPFQYLHLATSHGSSNYHGFQAQFRSRSFKGAQAMTSYAWSHAIDNGSRDGEVRLAALRKLDRGSADFDTRHSFVAAFLYPVPDLARHELLRGWNVDGFVRARSGFPFQPVVAGWPDEVSTGLNYAPNVSRPDFDASQPIWIHDPIVPGGRGLNTAAFPFPASRSTPGTLGRNSIGGFFFHQVDLALRRDFSLPGPAVLEFRAEAFNAFNRPNLSAPAFAALSGYANPPYFAPAMLVSQYLGLYGQGGAPSAGLLPQFQIGGPRSVQLSIKIAF